MRRRLLLTLARLLTELAMACPCGCSRCTEMRRIARQIDRSPTERLARVYALLAEVGHA